MMAFSILKKVGFGEKSKKKIKNKLAYIRKMDKIKNKLVDRHKKDIKYFIRFNYTDNIDYDTVMKVLKSNGVLNEE